MRIVAVTAKDSAFFTSGSLFMTVSKLFRQVSLFIGFLTPALISFKYTTSCIKGKRHCFHRSVYNKIYLYTYIIFFHWTIMKGRWVGAQRLLCLTPGQGERRVRALWARLSIFCIHKSQGDDGTRLSVSGVKAHGGDKHNIGIYILFLVLFFISLFFMTDVSLRWLGQCFCGYSGQNVT